MASTLDTILSIDIGSSGIRIGEFEFPASGENMVLQAFACDEYDASLAEADRSIQVASLLKKLLTSNNFTSKKVLVSVSGQSAFIRFVKLPPVSGDEARVRQIVEYEGRQNVPFSMDQVIWDYQLIGSNEENADLEVMFVVIKNEIVERITNAVQAVGLIPLVVDVAPSALYNAARANNLGVDESIMLLDIGGRSSNLVFIDGNKFFARTIPIAGYSMTQQIAKEFGISFEEADDLKKRHGFVALGGAFEEPQSEVAAIISKIVRNVMARLHGEISRSISVYSSQYKGRRPTKLYLAGGSSILAFTERFFAEKLRIETAFFNPFKVVPLGDVNKAELEEVAHLFSPVIGMGLRHGMECPVEINILPEDIRKQQHFSKKKPYFFIAITVMLFLLFMVFIGKSKQASLIKEMYDLNKGSIRRWDKNSQNIEQEKAEALRLQKRYDRLQSLLLSREYWSDTLNELQKIIPHSMNIETIEPIVGNIEIEKETSKKEKKVKKEEDEITSLFGNFGSKKKTKAKKDNSSDVIGGLLITGFSIRLPEKEKIKSLKKASSSDTKKNPKKMLQSKKVNQKVKSKLSPELQLLNKLKTTELFSFEGSSIIAYRYAEAHKNLSSFTIRLKFKNNIPQKRF